MSYLSHRVLFFCALLLSTASVLAQQPLSLTNAIEKALENNFQIKLAKAEAAVTQNNDDWSLTGRYPTVNLTLGANGSYVNSDNPASVVVKSSVLNTGIVPGAEANWVIFDGYRASFVKQQLEGASKLSLGQYKQQVETSIQAVMQAYYGARVQLDQLNILKKVMDLSRDRVNYQQVRQEFGQANTFDLLQAKDAYLSDSTTYLVQRNVYENALRSLLTLIGEDIYTPCNLTDSLTVPQNIYNYADLEARMLGNNSALGNLALNRQLAGINTRLLETALKPTISLRTGLSYNTGIGFGVQTFNTGGNPVERKVPQVAAKNLNAFLNIGLTYNIFDGGARHRRIGSAKLQEIQAQVGYESQKQQLTTQLANTLATYTNQQQLIALTNDLVSNAVRNLNIAEERLKAGLISSFDYRTVQLRYLNATQSQLNAVLNLKNTETELIRLTGGLVQ